ncbi:MAG TPA: hypothetical protein ENO30_02205 [Thermodesulfobium narugense]|nr:hypothetical protein [Thermodesulfobium narugense]
MEKKVLAEEIFNVDAEILKSVLQFTTNKTKMDILNTIIFEVKNKSLYIKSCDLTSYIIVEVPASITRASTFAISNKAKNILANLQKDVLVQDGGQFVVFQGKKTQYKFAKKDLDAYPQFPDEEPYEILTVVPNHIFTFGFSFVNDVLDKQHNNIQITFNKDKQTIEFFATNNQVLKIATYPFPVSQQAVINLSPESIEPFFKLAPLSEIEIGESGTFYSFKAPNINLFIRKHYAEVIDYERFLKAPKDQYAVIDTEALNRLIQLARLGQIIRLTINNDTVAVALENGKDTGEDEIFCKNTGFSGSYTFYYEDVIKFFNKVKGEEVYLYSLDENVLSLYSKESDWNFYCSAISRE